MQKYSISVVGEGYMQGSLVVSGQLGRTVLSFHSVDLRGRTQVFRLATSAHY